MMTKQRDPTLLLAAAPIIAAIRNDELLSAACSSDAAILFILRSDLSSAAHTVQIAKDAKKCVFIHFDLVEGLSGDASALRYLRETTAADGIISTRSQAIRAAKDMGFITVQRFFVVDSQAEENVLRTVSQTQHDFIELMPGIIPTVLARLIKHLSVPVIAGGLIETKEQIIELLSAGAAGVSTGKSSLWDV